MNVRVKKLIGTVILILLVSIYAIFATAFATLYLGQSSGWVHLAYFFFTGMLWVVPAMFVIKWMLTPPRSSRR
ncbi:DUF2842 domain-containing protein [Mangrovicella endophytica]|uniref:DUF2842 domain-containing protein n=1 Tax=Mangrovicella endophytica TaxID=2066697 RepID=UPI000C9E9895|nr:DUF2842 domain-containing protein [Mangrovicella endophytica]